MHGTTACKTLNINDHIPNQIIQQHLANDSVQINSTNLLKRRENIQNQPIQNRNYIVFCIF